MEKIDIHVVGRLLRLISDRQVIDLVLTYLSDFEAIQSYAGLVRQGHRHLWQG